MTLNQSMIPKTKYSQYYFALFVCLVAQLCPTLCDPWTVARQPPLSVGFSRQEYWSGLPCPPPGNPPHPGIIPRSPALQTDSLPSKPQGVKVVYFRGASLVAQE